MPVRDVLIVGAGPSGLAAAIAARQRGLDYAIVEQGVLVNSIFDFPTHMVFFTTPELLEIGDLPMISLGDKPTRAEGLKYYRRVTMHYQLDVHQYEPVLSITGEPGRFVVQTRDGYGAGHCYRAQRVILATGFYDIPNPLGCPGEDLPKVTHYYKEPHPFWNTDVAIVGAKNSAAIAALELFWAGARVTIIHRGDGISGSVKYWIKPNIENRIKAGEVKAYFQSTLKEIRAAAIVVSTPGGDVSLKNDFVLAMTGYRPDLDFLGSMGITLQPNTLKPLTDPETLESERKGIYLAGVIVAGILIMVYLANQYIAKYGVVSPVKAFACLFAALGLGWLVNAYVLGGGSVPLGWLVMPVVLTLPLFFAGLIFSSELKNGGDIASALSANLFGSMLGGFLEYNSMYAGFQSLYPLGLGLYGLAFLCLLRSRRAASLAGDESPGIETRHAA